jgi:cell division protease FtsH
MVGTWGMSAEVGMVAVTPDEGRGPFGFVGSGAHSERTQELVDAEVRRIVGESYDSVLALLSEYRTKLDALAEALLEHETLDQDAAYEAAGIASNQAPESAQVAG